MGSEVGLTRLWTSMFESEGLRTACLRLGVPTVYTHLPIVAASAASFFLVEKLSSWLSPRLFPRHYPQLSKRTKLEWDMKVVRVVFWCRHSTFCFWRSSEPIVIGRLGPWDCVDSAFGLFDHVSLGSRPG